MQTRPLLCSRVLRGELLVPRLLKRLLSHARFHPFRLLRSWPASASADKPSLTSDFAQYLPAIGVTLQDVAKARSWTVPPSRFEAQIAARAQKAPELSSNSSSAEAAAEVAVFMPAKTVFAAMRDEAKEAGEPRTSMELADALAHIQKQEERQAAASAAGRGQSNESSNFWPRKMSLRSRRHSPLPPDHATFLTCRKTQRSTQTRQVYLTTLRLCKRIWTLLPSPEGASRIRTSASAG